MLVPQHAYAWCPQHAYAGALSVLVHGALMPRALWMQVLANISFADTIYGVLDIDGDGKVPKCPKCPLDALNIFPRHFNFMPLQVHTIAPTCPHHALACIPAYASLGRPHAPLSD